MPIFLTGKNLGGILLSLILFLPTTKLLAVEIEPLLVGKEGRNYHYKDLFRRGHNYYQTFRYDDDKIYMRQNQVAQPQQLQLLPEFSQRENLLTDFRNYAANDFVELFFEMEKFPPWADTLYILNRLLQMHTMTGMQYFSTRQQEMTTYITSCYVVDKANSKKKLPPPQFSKLPTEPIRLVIRQDDNRFTATWYAVVISVGTDGLRLTMTNITPIYVQFIFYFKALDTGKVRHEIIIINGKKNKKPIIYALSQIHNKRSKILGIELDLGNSFNRRMSAVQGWVSQRIHDTQS